MSRLSLSMILSQQHHINSMIYDITNEIESSKKCVLHLEEQLIRMREHVTGLKIKLLEKQTMLEDSILLMNRVQKDKYNEKKIIYSIRCQHYLSSLSKQQYDFQDLPTDEIISTAHKLHFTRCLQNHKVFFPKDENDFDNFEKIHRRNNHIFLSPTFFINTNIWYNITEYDNQFSFTIDSDMSFLSNLEMYNLLIPSSDTIWSITS